MACDGVVKAMLNAIAHNLQHASARRLDRPIELQPSLLRTHRHRTLAESFKEHDQRTGIVCIKAM